MSILPDLETFLLALSISSLFLMAYVLRLRTVERDMLRKTTEKLQDAQRIAKIASWELDVATGKVKWSDYCFDMFELSPDSFDRTWQSLMPMFDEENQKIILDNYAKTMATKKAQDLDYAITTKSGVRKQLHTRGYVELDGNGEIVRMRGTTQDVTELRRVENELREARRIADESNQAKSNFLANMSHEIRTPLNIIVGFSELLIDPNETPEHRAEFVKSIQKNGAMLSDLISGILDLSKVESGRLEPKREEFELQKFLDDVEAQMKLKAEESGLELRFRHFGLLPTKIESDPRLLKQVFVNVVGNAIKFTQKGHIEVRTSMMTTQSGKRLLSFDVVDTGIGLTKIQRSRLFKRFAQADDTMTRKFGGTGLGLVLSRRLVRTLGGDLRIRYSVPGKGTCFRITIDPGSLESRLFIRELAAPVVTPQTFQTGHRHDLEGEKVLVVDDSVDNQILVEHFLQAAGAEVTKAMNGAEAIDKAMSGDFDVVLMDLQMPVLDGLSATHELRAKGYTKPIIALTAHALADDRERC
ncbi:MAG: ATP-binding protein, partial [Bdellovibrionota bacterium]